MVYALHTYSFVCLHATVAETLVIYQAWDAVLYHQSKHREESWKYKVQWSFFWLTSKCLNTVSNAWCYFWNKMILEGEIKDSKMSSFLSDFQIFIKN